MENFLETSSKEEESETTQKNNTIIFQEAKISEEEDQRPITSDQRPPREICCKPASTPDRLKVPKPFKYPERYMSPTDLMISPVSKGLLARTRKPNGSNLLPPSKIQPKLQSFQVQEAGLFPC
ncbi:hypothetical protein M9H77_15581 [Catharanthus roseus]|uniref:Uncharacterized protein n=1 Tax=Catharanthus roseus TaxID=4058 RepID=A0ACC0AXM3_CATRO|nr:hypothetical protein M9H77_15581 [Catharanthus roseus]